MFRWKARSSSTPWQTRVSGLVFKPTRSNHFSIAAWGAGGPAHHLAEEEGKKMKRPRSRNGSIELAQRARRRVARVGKYLLSLFTLAFIERSEIGVAHVHFAADLTNLRNIHAAKPDGHIPDGSDVGGHVFAFKTVAAGSAAREPPALVAQRAGEAVDLRLRDDSDFLILG